MALAEQTSHLVNSAHAMPLAVRMPGLFSGQKPVE
jgi:hypothetical protein